MGISLSALVRFQGELYDMSGSQPQKDCLEVPDPDLDPVDTDTWVTETDKSPYPCGANSLGGETQEVMK